MKKRNIIILILVVLLVVALIVGACLVYKNVLENQQEYEIAKIEQYNYFCLKQNDLYGVMDKKGNTIISPEYEEIKIPNPEKGIFICYKAEQPQALNEKGEQILTGYNKVEPIRLKNISSDLMYEKSVLKYEKDGKYGLVDFEGKQITKPDYDEIETLPYKEGELLVKQNDKYGVINIKGKSLIDIQYDQISVDEYYTEENDYQYAGYIVSITTDEGYRYGYLDYKGNKILDTQYNEMERITQLQDDNNKYLICAKNGQYGVAKNENLIIENEYQSIQYDSTNQVFILEKSKQYGVANLEGKLIIPLQYSQIDITGIYLYAKNEQGVTVYDKNGTQASIDSNISILKTENEKYQIEINNQDGTKYGVINQDGKTLIEQKYNYIEYLYDNYFIISNENGKLGVVDEKDNEKIEAIYDSMQKIQDTDLIQTTLSEAKTTQIYSKNMQKICEMQDATIEKLNNNIKIYNENEIKYFDLEGKELSNTQVYANNKLFVKKEGDKYGFVDKSGNVVVDYKYDKAYEFNIYGFAAVQKDGKWGAIDEQGQEVVGPIYEIQEQEEPFFIGKYYQVVYGFGEIYYTDANL